MTNSPHLRPAVAAAAFLLLGLSACCACRGRGPATPPAAVATSPLTLRTETAPRARVGALELTLEAVEFGFVREGGLPVEVPNVRLALARDGLRDGLSLGLNAPVTALGHRVELLDAGDGERDGVAEGFATLRVEVVDE